MDGRMDGTWEDGGTTGRMDELACSPVLALTIQKISINYCSFYVFEGTLIGSVELPRLPVVTKRGKKTQGQATLIIAETKSVDIKREKKSMLDPVRLQETNELLTLMCLREYAARSSQLSLP